MSVTPDFVYKELPAEPARVRLENCRVVLRLNGFLTNAENDRVRRRIAKWVSEESEDEREDER